MSAIKIIDFEAGQKLIDPDATLLWPEFEYDGMKLDLYGEIDSNGDYFVHDAAFANMRISLLTFLTIRQLEYFTDQCNAYLPGALEREQNDRADAWEMQHG